MNIGFTGTKMGMSQFQYEKVFDILNLCEVNEFHHGDCVGSDKESHEIASKLNIDIVIHPPIKDSKRAFCKGYKNLYKKKEYLDRNRDIVDETNLLIATPCGEKEVIRSGTWYTIRYAKKIGKPIIIVFPDGSTNKINGGIV